MNLKFVFLGWWGGKISLHLLRKDYTVKQGNRFFSITRRDITDRTIPGWDKVIYSRPGRVWSVTYRPAGDGKIDKPFLQCTHKVLIVLTEKKQLIRNVTLRIDSVEL